MGFFVPILFILGTSFTFSILLKRRVDEVLPFAIMSSTLTVYFFGLISRISVGYYVVVMIAVLSIFISLYYLVKLKNKEFIYKLLTPGLFVFIGLYVFVYVINLNRLFYQWDEFSHWGPMVKEMLRLDTFYSVPESTLYHHKNYPPVISLFETIWCMLAGSYKEGYIYRSIQILSFSMFFPMLSKLKYDKKIKSLFQFLLSVLLIILVKNAIPLEDANFYKTVYIDSVLAVTFAYGMYLVFILDYSKFEWVRLIVTLCFLLLSKQMGIVFFLIIIGTLFLYNLYNNWINKYKITQINNILFLLTIIIPYLAKLSWDLYIKQFNVSMQFVTSDISLKSFIGIVQGTTGEAYQHEAFINFMTALYTKPILTYPFEMTYTHVIVVFALLYGLLYYFSREYKEKHKVALMGLIMVLGAFAYAFIMLLLYVFNFGFYEGPRLASYVRYMNTYWYASLSLLLMMFITLIAYRKEKKINKYLFATVISMLLIFYNKYNIKDFTPAIDANSGVQVYYNDIDIIQNYTDKEGSVFIVVQKTNGYPTNVIRYYINPQWVNDSYYSLGKPYSDQDVWTKDLTMNELSNILLDYDYVYLLDVDDQFRYTYLDLFEKETYPDNEQLFKVIKKENELVFLERIY